jgi:prophage DNA circulation protein
MSGGLGAVTRTLGAAAGVANGIGQLANGLSSVLGATSYLGPAPGLGPWAATLQVASWRGLPFAVRSSIIRRGRRIAVHEYPFRDEVWVEDLGRGVRSVSFSAFLIGDDVFAQRDAMAMAAETAGPGTLVHPSLGALTATLTDFSAGERADLGRVVEIEFSFIQSGQDQPVFPSTVISTQSVVMSAASSSIQAAAADFVSDVTSSVELGFVAVQGAIGTAVGFVSMVIGTASAFVQLGLSVISLPAQILGDVLNASDTNLGLLNDAAVTFGSVAGLPGNNGRFSSAGLTVALPATATVESQLDALATNRATVQTDMGAVLTGLLMAPLDLPATIQAAIDTFQTAVQSPSDQLRLLAVLAAFSPTIATNSAPIGVAIAQIQTSVAALVRRTACAALATAAANYQPTSYNDAITQLDTVTSPIETEAISAADAGDTGTYVALEALRAAVADDLLTRGGQLPSLVTITTAVPLPSLTLAYKLYGDATRADDLTARADPIAPLFMPTSFQALAA